MKKKQKKNKSEKKKQKKENHTKKIQKIHFWHNKKNQTYALRVFFFPEKCSIRLPGRLKLLLQKSVVQKEKRKERREKKREPFTPRTTPLSARFVIFFIFWKSWD